MSAKRFSKVAIPTFLFISMSIVGLEGCSKHEEVNLASYASTHQLGNLSAFRMIASDTAVIVDKGDLVAAKTRIKDLESAWDAAETGLKPRSSKDWHVVDSAIDKALKALRQDQPNQQDCKQALSELLTAMDVMSAS